MGVETDRFGQVFDADTMHPSGQQAVVSVVQKHVRSFSLGQRQPVIDVDGGDVFLEVLIGQVGHDHFPCCIHVAVFFSMTCHVT